MPPDQKTGTTGATGTGTGSPEPAAPPPQTQASADAEETRKLLRASEQRQTKLAEELEAQRRRNAELEARFNAAELGRKIDGYRERLVKLRDSNRITPAVYEKLASQESLAVFGEGKQDFVLEALEQLPGTAIPMGERGTGGTPDTSLGGAVDEKALTTRMHAIFSERSQADKSFTMVQAAKLAADEVLGTRKGG